MKTVLFMAVVSLLFFSMAECGGLTGAVSATFNTGDAEFDITLSSLNDEANLDVKVFIGDMSLAFSTGEEDVKKLMSETKMRPSDVYMALNIARITEIALPDVVKEYKAHHKHGWGVIAKRLGIKPGSKAFHELKKIGSVRLEKIKENKKEKGKPEKKEKPEHKVKPKHKGKKKGRGKKG